MATILKTKSIYYNDVNLIAQPSIIHSRSEVPKELNRIIVSPMESIIGETFAKEANNLGLTICLHRFCPVETQISIFNKLKNKENVFVAVGANDFERVKSLADNGAINFLIDIANGYIPTLRTTVRKIQNIVKLNKIMVGNVMTDTGFYNSTNCGIETYVRVGIAGGSPCSTSDATGNYAAKAFGAGADFVMMGGYFARALEAETHIIGDGTYWGGASHKQQERFGGIKKHSEGKVLTIEDELKPLSQLIDELWGGLSSAISYSGYGTLNKFIGNGVFEIKQNSLPPRR